MNTDHTVPQSERTGMAAVKQATLFTFLAYFYPGSVATGRGNKLIVGLMSVNPM
jgi:hypothetical protein